MKGEIATKLVGAWRYLGTRFDGAAWDRGAHPKGMIVYTAGGHMAVQIAPDVERPRAGAAITPQEALVAIKDYIAYVGTYSVDESAGTVTHHRQAALQPGDIGPLVRRCEFVGDRLTLLPPNSTLEVMWERIR